MFSALGKAIRQSGDPAFRGVFLRALFLSILLFALSWAAAWWGLSWGGETLAAWTTEMGIEGFWHELVLWLVQGLAVAGILVASLFLFPAITGLMLSFLLDQIAAAVEARHYPDLPAPRSPPLSETLVGALGFAATTILANLIALPFYLLLTFVPPLNLFVFYGLNGYLLGREYFEMVAARRLDGASARRMRKQFRGRVFMAGVIIAFLLTLPVINLVTPIVATGFMLHVFETLRRRSAGAQPAT